MFLDQALIKSNNPTSLIKLPASPCSAEDKSNNLKSKLDQDNINQNMDSAKINLQLTQWKDEVLLHFKINQDLANMILFLSSIKKVDLLLVKILESENLNLKFLDQDPMIIKMLFLNMVVNNSLNMDLVLEFR